jgi:hypothetical protein
MATHNELTDPSAGSSSVGRRSRWVAEHGLLAYTLIAYGISWSLLIGGFLSSRAGILNPDGSLVSLIIQIAAAGPLISALIVLALTRGRRGLADLGRSLIRWRVNPLWYAFVFLGVPILMLAALAIIYQGQLGSALTEKVVAVLHPVADRSVEHRTPHRTRRGTGMAWVRPADRQSAVSPHDCGLGGLGDLGTLAPAQRPVRADRDRDRRPLPCDCGQWLRAGLGLQLHRRQRATGHAAPRRPERN